MERAALVIGGGIAGIQASLDLADRGIIVYLVEKEPTIGGKMARLDKTFPTNDCSACILSPKMADCYGHQNINVLSYSEVLGLDGVPGDFVAKVVKKARYVDEEKCTGCGDCVAKCPVGKKGTVPDQFEFGLVSRSAIYIPHAQAVPRVAIIDPETCLKLTKDKCGACQKVCQRGAIDYEAKDEIVELNVGSVICAAGFDLYDATKSTEYGYGRYQNVVTSMEYERMMSAAGPTGGHIKVPSTGEQPRKIAFIQCVGSRSVKEGCGPYCSSVCCMYSTKQAIIGMEHMEGVEEHIYFMDIRAFGKEFEDYITRAEGEYGIKLHRSARVSNIQEDQTTKRLYLNYSKKDCDPATEDFDLVVLSIGLRPSASGQALAKTLGLDLNEYGFCDTKVFDPLATSREGVYVTGAFAAPKDIPTSVAEASGAAAKAGKHIAGPGFTRAAAKQYPPEKEVIGMEPRIGVFVCDCGINISATVDVPSVVEYASTLPNVVYATERMYTCAQDSLEIIKESIAKEDLNRVVVASCTPRTHEPLFRNACQEGGLNPYLFEMANIRDQCSWIHMHEPERATVKAKDLVKMAVAKSRLLEPLYKEDLPVINSAVIVGGGIAGMTAALDIANQGYDAHIIERTDRLGGKLNTFSHEEDGTATKAFLDDMIAKIRDHDKVIVHLDTELSDITGFVGNFTVHLAEEEFDVGSVIIATGASEYVPTEYMYGKDDRVVTNLELERKFSEGGVDAKRVAFIQCVGSRNKDVPYCSRVCCATALRNAIRLKEADPSTEVLVFHKDIRTYGFREELYRRASELGVSFIRFPDDKDPELSTVGDGLRITAYDTILGDEVSFDPSLLVLSNGIRPDLENNETLAQMLKIPTSKDGFFFEAHMKLRPVDFATEGVFLAGLAHWPKFVDETIAQASGAASRALTIISKDSIEAEGVTANVNLDICDGCGICEDICPYHAITMIEVEDQKRANVNPGICKGCGACVAACPSGAMEQRGFKNAQILAMVESVLMEE